LPDPTLRFRLHPAATACRSTLAGASHRYEDGTLFLGRCSDGVVGTPPPHLPARRAPPRITSDALTPNPDCGGCPHGNPGLIPVPNNPYPDVGSCTRGIRGGLGQLALPCSVYRYLLPSHPGTPVCANHRKRRSVLSCCARLLQHLARAPVSRSPHVHAASGERPAPRPCSADESVAFPTVAGRGTPCPSMGFVPLRGHPGSAVPLGVPFGLSLRLLGGGSCIPDTGASRSRRASQARGTIPTGVRPVR